MVNVSIIVPVYNVERYLRQCLNSLVTQTLKDIEIICVDDGSTDSCGDILDEYARNNSNMTVIYKENKGYGHSVNMGLERARGEYIGIVESDDFVEKDMFERLYQEACLSNADIVKSNYYMQSDAEFRLVENLKGLPYETVFCPRTQYPGIFYSLQAIWSAIYKRDFLLKNKLKFIETPGAAYQDFSFVFKSFACANQVYLIKDAFVHYRVDNPGSSVKSKDKAFAIFNEFHEVTRFLAEREDLLNPCQYYFEPLKFEHGLLHIKRVFDTYGYSFSQFLATDFQKDETAGFLDKAYWKPERWEKLQSLLQSADRFHYDICSRLTLYHTIRDGVISRLHRTKRVYLYGAGQIARSLIPFLKKHGIAITGILVSSEKDNPETLCGIPVCFYETASVNKDDDGILLTVRDETQQEVLGQLQQDGVINISVIPRFIREILLLDDDVWLAITARDGVSYSIWERI